MAYQCLDCSFKGQQFPQGRCPACNSSRVRRLDLTNQADDSKKAGLLQRYNLHICVAVWIGLLIVIYQKFIA